MNGFLQGMNQFWGIMNHLRGIMNIFPIIRETASHPTGSVSGFARF
ncbi:MAG: hypothetical protein Q8929_12700 [Bacillota bacterium]|nr:hypothetical protein [Bacillota bacterium]